MLLFAQSISISIYPSPSGWYTIHLPIHITWKKKLKSKESETEADADGEARAAVEAIQTKTRRKKLRNSPAHTLEFIIVMQMKEVRETAADSSPFLTLTLHGFHQSTEFEVRLWNGSNTSNNSNTYSGNILMPWEMRKRHTIRLLTHGKKNYWIIWKIKN